MADFTGSIRDTSDRAIEDVARRRAAQAPSSRPKVNPDMDRLIRVAAGGEAGDQGFQAQRDAQFQQDSGVRQAAEFGRFPLDVDTPQAPAPAPAPTIGFPDRPPISQEFLDRPSPLVRGGAPAHGTEDPAAVAVSPFSTDEDIARALLGIPEGAALDLGAVINDLDSDEQGLFFQAFNELLDFQDRRTQQSQQEEAFELQQQQAQQDRATQQLLTASQLLDSGNFSDDQILQATGINVSQFGGQQGVNQALDQLEKEKGQTDRALGLLDFSQFQPGGFDQASTGLITEEARSGAQGDTRVGLPIPGLGFDLPGEGTEDTATTKEALEFVRSADGVELEGDIRKELAAGTSFKEVAQLIRDTGTILDLSDEIVRGLINRWSSAFSQRRVALEELLG